MKTRQRSKNRRVIPIQSRSLRHLLPCLLDDSRCLDAKRVFARFEHCMKTWRQNHTIRSVIETVNELAAAAILTRLLLRFGS